MYIAGVAGGYKTLRCSVNILRAQAQQQELQWEQAKIPYLFKVQFFTCVSPLVS